MVPRENFHDERFRPFTAALFMNRDDIHGQGHPGALEDTMHRIIRWLLAGVFATLVAGCASTPDVRTSHDPSVDFSRFRTFAFVTPLGTDRAGYESLVSQQLKSSTQREMEARGYQFVQADPDLLVNFNASLTQQTRVRSDPYMGYYGYRYGYYGGWPGYSTTVDQYEEGTLNIDVVDARTKRLVWEGVAVGRVTDKARENRGAAIDAAVAQIFQKYPYRAGQ
jgi:hypothetical protein